MDGQAVEKIEKPRKLIQMGDNVAIAAIGALVKRAGGSIGWKELSAQLRREVGCDPMYAWGLVRGLRIGAALELIDGGLYSIGPNFPTLGEPVVSGKSPEECAAFVARVLRERGLEP